MTRSVAWTRDDGCGAEFATVEFGVAALRASGVAIGSEPEPYRLDYELETGPRFAAVRVLVAIHGDGWSRQIELDRRHPQAWRARVEQTGHVDLPDAGGELGELTDVVDPDLGLSPLFNTMPVLRHGLLRGGTAEFVMVWISVPDLSLHRSPQRYTHLKDRGDEHVVRFEATGEGASFVADIVFDADGLVVDYPGIASRIR
jgi:hypothetical protein